jgi:hypothetical protein
MPLWADLDSSMKEFFKDRDLLKMVDRMAQRYGKLPHEILCNLTMHEFDLDLAVMVASEYEELKTKHGTVKTDKEIDEIYKKFKIDRQVITKGKR